MITSRFSKWKTAMQLFAIIFLLLLIGIQQVTEHFFNMGVVVEVKIIELLANGLMSAVLVLTILSGLHYVFRYRTCKKSANPQN